MSLTPAANPPAPPAAVPPAPPAPPSRLTIWAGRTMLVIAVAHTALFATLAPWSSWLAGDLHDNAADSDSVATFWALPGGFVVVLALLGLLAARAGRQGQLLPGYVGWTLLAWGALAVSLIGPSGFLFIAVPAGLLITADIAARRQRRSSS
ncbi:DUF6463 family protein [Nonomuraea rhodomycinica]|uniref:Uncharacterized protein n=1 Tax=Nonomuraea rhodomycinica TaxID=1712872 RepID=A0A7Y6MGJ2_9ACTN|nr:DUF6463 family protein [Nonomuraea rhodomycinica]NUW45766.1 hypothetical protein [Nonomuraea rhodomycinica]